MYIQVAKSILANAVLHIPSSVKVRSLNPHSSDVFSALGTTSMFQVWLYAADLETTEARKKAVLRRSLEFVPNSVKLWYQHINDPILKPEC